MNLLDAQKMALAEMLEHGLIAEGWTFTWATGRRAMGHCNYTRRTIRLARVYAELNPPAEVLDTIRHEIAHALCPGDAHGARWRAKCRELGCTPRRRGRPPVSPIDAGPRYVATCEHCGHKHRRLRRPNWNHVLYCGPCRTRHRQHAKPLQFQRVEA